MAQAGFKLDAAALRPGDIVFAAKSKNASEAKMATARSALNVNGQRVLAALRRGDRIGLRAKVGPWKHVMLAVGNGLVIHADGHKVAIENARDVIVPGDEEGHFKILRRDDLSEETSRQIASEAQRYLEQKYSFFNYFRVVKSGRIRKRKNFTQYCSQLVAHAYVSAGLPFSALPEHRVLPIDLFIACQAGPWRDVTSEILQPPRIARDRRTEEALAALPFGLDFIDRFFEETDKLLGDVADNGKLLAYHSLGSYDQTIQIVSGLKEHGKAMYQMALLLRYDVTLIDDELSLMIARLMEQVEELLHLPLIPDLAAIVPPLYGGDEGRLIPAYAGRPTLAELRDRQLDGEMFRLMGYVLFMETGLTALVARLTKKPELEHYAKLDHGYAKLFLNSLPHLPSISAVDRPSEASFAWIKDAKQRSTTKRAFENIVISLDVLKAIYMNEAGAANRNQNETAV